MNANRIFGRSNLGGMRWSATARSRPDRFQARRNASLESLGRGAILEHRPVGTLPTILKLLPTRKRPWTTWLTRKLLWTLGTRRRGREREPHNTARGCHESHQDDNNRNLPLSRIRDSAMASVVELVCGRLPHACRPTPHVAIPSACLGTSEGRRVGRRQAKH
jgi:hypothetical protein